MGIAQTGRNDDFGQAAPDHVLAFVAKSFLRRRIPFGDDGLFANGDDAVQSRFHNRGFAGFAGAQFGGGLALGGHIGVGAEITHDLAVCVSHGRRARQKTNGIGRRPCAGETCLPIAALRVAPLASPRSRRPHSRDGEPPASPNLPSRKMWCRCIHTSGRYTKKCGHSRRRPTPIAASSSPGFGTAAGSRADALRRLFSRKYLQRSPRRR